jgi:ACS family hexuronate transporter-like MFS transporter
MVIGAIGFLWLIFWYKYYDTPELKLSKEEYSYVNSDVDTSIENDTNTERVSWSTLLKFKQTWSFIIGKFMTDGVWWFFLFWLPGFLKDQYQMTSTEMMWPLAILYSITMIGSVGGGWFPTYFINRGAEVYAGRMKAMLTIAIFPLIVLLAQPFGHISFWIPVFLIGIGTAAHQAWSANIFTTVSDMFPKKAVASVVGIGGMAGGIGGVIVTKIAGALFDHYKALGQIETGYSIMFAFCAVAYLIAWFIMKSLVPKHEAIVI